MSSPSSRLGSLINENAKFQSKSVGKSLISYLLGHAICKGYVESIDSQIKLKKFMDEEKKIYNDMDKKSLEYLIENSK